MRVLDWIFARILRVFADVCYYQQAKSILERACTLRQTASQPQEVQALIQTLIIAEDRRFKLHRGIDCRAVGRAAIVTVLTQRVQGGSTITQQLVRVISGDYRRSIARKFKELCLASWIDLRVSKEDQAIIYLSIAYFGWRMIGWEHAAARLGIDIPCSFRDAAAIIARLKYPEPRQASQFRLSQIHARQAHIHRLLKRHERYDTGTP